MDYLYSPYQDLWPNGHSSFSENSVKEKEFKTSNKTEDEMKRLTMDESLSETQKASLIIAKGQSFQKYAIYGQLARLLKESESQGKLLQQVFDDIQTNEEELQIEAAKAFAKVIRERILDKTAEMKVFAVTLNILKIWSQPILIAWVEVFQEILNAVPFNTIEKDCNLIIIMLSDHSQPKASRYIAAILIGLVSEKLRESFPSTLMEKVRALCQDSDIEIRKLMANEVLEKICFSIGSEKTEIYVLEKIMELVYDGEINVKCAGIKLVFRIIDALSLEAKANRITTLFIELLASINEEVLKVISSQIGFIIYKLESFLKKNPSYLSSILSNFKEYGTHKLEEIRKNFSYNLPAILAIIDPKQFESLKGIYLAHLLGEKSLEIRQTAVSCLHEILKLIGWEECHKTFKDVFKALSKESNFLLVKKFVEHLNEILEAFYDEEIWAAEEYVNNFQDILGYIVNLGTRFQKENQWRLQERLLKELQKMVYLDFVSYSTAFFSQTFLRLHILPECFKLASDRVPNVRRKLAAILPQIRKRIDKSDLENFAKFNETIALLKKDIDLDVSDVLISGTITKTNHLLAKLPFDESFIKEIEAFEAEKLLEDEELRVIELKENEEAKKKDTVDLDLFNPNNYYSSMLSKSKNKAKVPGSAGLGNYRFMTSKNLGTPPNVNPGAGTLSGKLKSNKEISSFSPLSKPSSSLPNTNTTSFSPQPHKTSLVLQNSEKNVISVKKVEEKKKESREIYSSSKQTKPFDVKSTKFSTMEKEKDKKGASPSKKDLKKN